MLEIKVKYRDKSTPRLKKIDIGDWIDLSSNEDVEIKAGEYALIDLGVAMKLPDGYEAHIVPRSSTYKNYHVFQCNHMGIIDNKYSGDEDYWMFPAYAVHDTVIHNGDRICQFRIMKNQPSFIITEVDRLDCQNRGGFGSTGRN